MNDILVSVIIPVYNTEQYVEECISCVLKQTHSNLDIIVINDGSKDRSAELCKKFLSDPRITFIDRENRGLSATRQEGIDLAKGEYFCTLDSDDLQDEFFVEKMLKNILDSKADVCVCGRKDFDQCYERDLFLSSKKSVYELTKESVSLNMIDYVSELWLSDSWNKLYRTEFVRNSGVRFWLNNRYNGTDLSFNHMLALHCPKYCVCNEPLLLHRIVVGSRVHRKNKPLQEGFELIVDRVFEEAKKLDYPETFYSSYSACYLRFLNMTFSAIIDESESLGEVAKRFRPYRERRNQFGKKHPVLCPKNLAVSRGSVYQNMFAKSMLSNSIVLCFTVFILNGLRRFKQKIRSGS